MDEEKQQTHPITRELFAAELFVMLNWPKPRGHLLHSNCFRIAHTIVNAQANHTVDFIMCPMKWC